MAVVNSEKIIEYGLKVIISSHNPYSSFQLGHCWTRKIQMYCCFILQRSPKYGSHYLFLLSVLMLCFICLLLDFALLVTKKIQVFIKTKRKKKGRLNKTWWKRRLGRCAQQGEGRGITLGFGWGLWGLEIMYRIYLSSFIQGTSL